MANKIKERWKTQDGQDRLKRIVKALRNGQYDWQDILKDFPETKAIRDGRDLRYANLSGLDLQGIQFYDINFNGANFQNANLKKSVFRNTSLTYADFYKATLKKADLSGTKLYYAKFNNADIRGAKFENVELGELHRGGSFNQSELQGQVDFTNVRFNKKTSFLRTDSTRNNWSTNPLLLRHIQDQQWLYTWKNKCWFNKYFLYPIWCASCDCGRSFLLWAFWSFVFALGFGFIFHHFADCFYLANGATLAEASWFTPFYYSIVTFTTLGFGDVVPDINNGWMQFCVTLEVILGYMMLGGLISLFATKLARRA